MIYLSMLRGINVSGQKKILMKDLKILYEDAGFKNVQTYIQSGNVIFNSTSSKNLSQKIEQKILEKYQFQVSVIIRTIDEMAMAIKNNPLTKDKKIDQSRLYVTFLAELPGSDHVITMNTVNYQPEKFIIKEKEVFVFCPNGYRETKFSNNFIEKKLQVTATTRNWNTVNKLFLLMKD
ncbi:MAG: DUF1697 domain-containing protein [Chitinophagaceae bacterium]|jgi:uncharacterized protein (DUF1697 family)|nr:DUF1697 domain-containing protein [Chitinophagaceae bacterium]